MGMMQSFKNLFSGSTTKAGEVDTVSAVETSWLTNALGGVASSGVTITADNAMSVSAFFACTRILMEDVAKLPISVYQKYDGGKRKESKDDPLYRLLYKPNNWQTQFDFFEVVMANLILHGNAYIVILRDNRGKPKMLIPYAAWKVTVLVDPTDGDIFYQISRGNPHDTAVMQNQPLSLPASEVIHIRCMNTGGLLGTSILSKAREAIGLAIATEQHGSALFKNGAKPSGMLTHPQILSDTAKAAIKTAWDNIHSGFNQWGKTMVLEEGMKYEPLTMNSTDAEWLASRRFQVEEIARMFRMPLFMLQSLQDLKYNTVELQNRSYYDQTLMPYLERIEAAFDTHFNLRDKNRYVEFDTNALLRADIATRYNSYATARQWGWMSANDVLREEHKNEIGEQGDSYMVPANMFPADKWLQGAEVMSDDDND